MAVKCRLVNDEHLTVDDVDLVGESAMSWTGFVNHAQLISGPRRLMSSSWSTGDSQTWQVASGDTSGNNRVEMRIRTGTVTTSHRSDEDSLTTNEWYHIACVYNGTDMRIYINGTLNGGSTPKTGTLTSDGTNSTAIFTDPNQATTRDSDATMYDVRVYNRALSAEEVNAIYVSNGADGIFNGCLHRWKMDEFAPGSNISGANPIKDEIGGNDATNVGTPIGAEGVPNQRSTQKYFG